ncbi:MAG: hypothetical protein EBZ17_10640, partial [Actinobacteria bacterium]|nr:hypothetical protein [Actinomycetota bacterium]
DTVVLRTVAGALEPLRGDALGHAAAEVRALLVEGDDATVETQRKTGFHTGEFVRRVGGTGLLDRTVRVFGDPHATFRPVQEAVGTADLVEHVAHEADPNGRAEAATELGPQEGDRREAEAAETDLHHEDLYQKCPHLGCRVPECVTSQWFECPCHGSQYNRVGEKRGGPAPRGMDRFATSVSADGVLTVDTGTIIQGPPIGTNTTGQEAEGPNCIGQSSH